MKKLSPVRLFVADIGSSFAMWLDFIAVLTLSAYAFNATPLDVSLLASAGLLPTILLSRFAGEVAQKQAPLRTLRLIQLLRIVFTAAIFFVDSMPLLMLVIAARACASAFYMPSMNMLIMRVVGEDKKRYLANISAVNGLAKIFAPMLGSVLGAWLSLYAPFWLAITLLIFSSAALVGVGQVDQVGDSSTDSVPPPKPDGPSFAASPNALYGVVVCYFLCVFLVNNLLPVIFRDAGFSELVLGMVVGCAGAGGVTYSLVLSRLFKERAPTIRQLLASGGVMGTSFMLLSTLVASAAAYAEAIMCLLFFLTGIFSARFALISNLILFHRFGGTLGRASSRMQACQSMAMLLAPYAGSFALMFISGSALFFWAGILAVAVFGSLGAASWLYRQSPALTVRADGES